MMIKNDFQYYINKFLKYISVGSICTLCDYITYSLFLFIGLHFAFAALLSESLGVLYSFKAQDNIVFKKKDNRLVFKFILIYIVCYLINVSFLEILHLCNINMYLAGALTIPAMAVISFLLNEKFVFVTYAEGE